MPAKTLLALLFPVFLLTACTAGKNNASLPTNEAAAAQAKLNATYLDPKKTILPAEKLALLKEAGGLPFYPINDAYRVVATFKRYTNPEVIKMKTSSTRLVEYAVFGLATFKLNGETQKLTLYKTTRANLPPEYRNSMFLPFRDETSGKETYGGGRYLDVQIPEGDELVIDFNKAYHPYCAYTEGYSCPVVPKVNHLKTEILAGIKSVDLGD